MSNKLSKQLEDKGITAPTYKPEKVVDAVILTVVLGCATVLARKAAEKAWSYTFDEDPPSEKDNHDVDVKQALGWALFLGACSGVIRFVVRRSVHRGSWAKAFKSP